MKLKDLKILWLSDFDTQARPEGGAELTDSYVIEAGRELGFTIEWKTSLHTDILQALKNSDLVIVSNFYYHDISLMVKVFEKPFILYCHDTGNWMKRTKEFPSMFRKALFSIFLSPLHRKAFQNYINLSKTECIPPHFPKKFKITSLDRLNKAVYIGTLFHHKGILNIINYSKKNNLKVDFYFKRYDDFLYSSLKREKNCELKGYIQHQNLPIILNQYKYFIHLSEGIEAFGRAVGEAFLCGCSLIINKNVGAMSYFWSKDYKSFRQNTLYSHYKFWDILEDRVKL